MAIAKEEVTPLTIQKTKEFEDLYHKIDSFLWYDDTDNFYYSDEQAGIFYKFHYRPTPSSNEIYVISHHYHYTHYILQTSEFELHSLYWLACRNGKTPYQKFVKIEEKEQNNVT